MGFLIVQISNVKKQSFAGSSRIQISQQMITIIIYCFYVKYNVRNVDLLTLAPRIKRELQRAAPIPPAPPVTMATFPFSSILNFLESIHK